MAAAASKRSFSLYSDDEEDEKEVAKEKPNIADKEGDQPQVKKARTEDASISVPEVKNGSPTTAVVEKQNVFAPALLCALGAKRGEREDMQDAHLMTPFLLQGQNPAFLPVIKRCSLYCIFDGHAGARAAHYCEKHLAQILVRKLTACADFPALEKSLKRLFTETYKQVDDGFLVEARKQKPVWKDGTTATTVLLLNNCFYAANIGDSRAIVARSKKDGDKESMVAVQLTVDHSPQQFDERMRIQKAGGSVKDGRINGILEVSRSIGDGQFKTHGVTSVPDMKKLTITNDDKFLLIACDGLWKSFSNEEAIEFVLKHLESAKENEKIVASELKSVDQAIWEHVADEMAAEAVRRKCGDNVSVMLVRLEPLI